MTKAAGILLFLALFTASPCIDAQPVAQWRGPNRDGHFPGSGLLKEWPDGGPSLKWSCAGIGKGYSTAVCDGSRIYVTGMKDSTDYLSALDPAGRLLWQVPFGPSWNSTFPDTRCTPTVENGVVYVLSGLGRLSAIRAQDGTTVWSIDAVREFSAAYGEWGVCESLLLCDDLVIYTPGGPRTTVAALDKETGKTRWESPSLRDTSAYVSPALIRHGDRQIIVTVLSENLVGVDPSDGNILFRYPYALLKPEESLKVWPGAPRTNTITPLFKDGLLYVTGGYNHPGAMFRLAPDGTSVDLAWTDTTLDCHHGGVVLHEGFIYGSNWIDNSRGNWCCIDWETGTQQYQQKWQTKGSVIEADGMLYLFDEKNGNVGLLQPGKEGFALRGSFKIPLGKGACWAHPFIHDGTLYIRRGDVLMAFDLKSKP